MSAPVEIPGRASAGAAAEGGAGLSVSPGWSKPDGPIPSTPKVDGMDLETLDKEGHQLNTPWTFYFDRTTYGTTKEEYANNLKKIYSVRSIESFWGIFNHIPAVSQINLRCGYHLMRDHRRPMWEDVPEGGSWKFRIPKDKSDIVWKEMLLATIGEQFLTSVHDDDQILGIGITTRQTDDIVQIWNAKSKHHKDCKVLAKLLELVPGLRINTTFYKSHEENMKRN